MHLQKIKTNSFAKHRIELHSTLKLIEHLQVCSTQQFLPLIFFLWKCSGFDHRQDHNIIFTLCSHLFLCLTSLLICLKRHCPLHLCFVCFLPHVFVILFFLACLSSSEGIDFWVLLRGSEMTASRKVLCCYFNIFSLNLVGLRLRLQKQQYSCGS